MTDRENEMDNLIAQDADMIEVYPRDRQKIILMCIRNAADWEGVGARTAASFWANLAIEIQSIETLHAALSEIAAECVVPVGSDAQMYKRWRKLATTRVDIARKALGMKK